MSGSVTIVGLLAASAALQVFTGPAVSAGTRPPTSLPHGTTQLIRLVAPSYGATYPGANPEPMDQLPAYGLGAVIAYNTARVPGLGSAIFLHVGTGGPTAGCVSLPVYRLRKTLLWLRPGDDPQIRMRVSF